MKAMESNAVAANNTGAPFKNAGTGLDLSRLRIPAKSSIDSIKPRETPKA
jgi:hypothetical protein